jgi:hypothetical protein
MVSGGSKPGGDAMIGGDEGGAVAREAGGGSETGGEAERGAGTSRAAVVARGLTTAGAGAATGREGEGEGRDGTEEISSRAEGDGVTKTGAGEVESLDTTVSLSGGRLTRAAGGELLRGATRGE